MTSANGPATGGPAEAEAPPPHVKSHVFLLTEGMAMMLLAGAIEPLRSANRLLGREVYRWSLASLDGESVAMSNGIVLPAQPVETVMAQADILYVCGGVRIQSARERDYLSVLRRAARQGIALGSLSTGAYLLARAGLLDGYRCTTHWESLPAFEEEFPHLNWTGKLFEIDRNRLTSCGGTAVIDMMLHLITQDHGSQLAAAIANQYHHERIRPRDHGQRVGDAVEMLHAPASVRTAVKTMQNHIEDSLSVVQIAAAAGISVRQLERLFLQYLHTTPARYYIGLRLERARELLVYTDASIIEVAVQSGFSSTSHFSSWFRRSFGVKPSQLRAVPLTKPPAVKPPAELIRS